MNEHEPYAARLIKQINDALARHFNNDVRTRGTTLQQMNVLLALHESPEGVLSYKRLERLLGIAQPTMWGLITRIEAKGWAVSSNNPDDARTKVVRITDAGRQLCRDCMSNIQMTERMLVSRLSPSETKMLFELLQRVYESIA